MDFYDVKSKGLKMKTQQDIIDQCVSTVRLFLQDLLSHIDDWEEQSRNKMEEEYEDMYR